MIFFEIVIFPISPTIRRMCKLKNHHLRLMVAIIGKRNFILNGWPAKTAC